MRRAGQRLVAAALVATAALVGRAGHAFHVGRDFDKPAGAGGGGGLFYTGSIADKGWTCTACHLAAPGEVRVELEVDPPLLDTFRFDPGADYRFTVRLVGETRGLSDPLSNFNTVAISFVDAGGRPAGAISGYAAEDFWAGTAATIVSSGRANEEVWTFTWRAPGPEAGPTSVHVAAVDGDAGGRLDGTGGDPFGDDVLVGAVSIAPRTVTAARGSSAGHAPPWLAGVIAAVAFARRARGRAQRPRASSSSV